MVPSQLSTYHPNSTPNWIVENNKMPGLQILNEIKFVVFSFFSPRTIPFTDQSQTISMDHSIESIYEAFYSWTNVKLYPQTIPFTDYLQINATDLWSINTDL